MGTSMMAADAPQWRGWKTFFLLAALWDLVLGAAFFFLFSPIYDALKLPLPNLPVYIRMISGFVFVQGAGYWLVHNNPLGNVDIVRLGALYKVIFAGVVFYYVAIGQTPGTVFALFAAVDVVFVLFFLSFVSKAKAVRT